VKSIDYDAISNNIDLCKEVADGLRVYFNFVLKDFLLYTEEKEEYERIMSEENLKDFRYDPGEPLMLDDFFSKSEPYIPIPENQQQETPENQTPSISSEKRINTRLRSHSLKTDDDEKPENLSSMASTSSNDSSPMMELNRKGIFSKEWKPLNSGLSSAAYKIIEEVFNWRMVGDDSNPEPSMIFGIYHLSRLVVKLPGKLL
jgi:male-specific lethal 3